MLAQGAYPPTMGPPGSVDPLVQAILAGLSRRRLPPPQGVPSYMAQGVPSYMAPASPMNLTGLLGAIVAQRPTMGTDSRMKAEVLHTLAGLR